MKKVNYTLEPIGFVESTITQRENAPSQGNEGAPDVWITLNKNVAEGLDGVHVGDKVIVLTWFHQSKRDVLKLHPRWDKNNPLTGVLLHALPTDPIQSDFIPSPFSKWPATKSKYRIWRLFMKRPLLTLSRLFND